MITLNNEKDLQCSSVVFFAGGVQSVVFASILSKRVLKLSVKVRLAGDFEERRQSIVPRRSADLRDRSGTLRCVRDNEL